MKNSVKFSPKFKALSILSTLILFFAITACEPEQDVDPVTISTIEESFTAGPEGGSFTALNGIVDLEIPRNALNAEVKIRIKIGPEDYDNDFIVRSIVIYPKSLTFEIPGRLRLKYDGKLSNGKDPCDAKCLAIYHFENEAAFDKRNPSDMIWKNKCCVNLMDQCIETEINSGGIFAIGEESLDQTDH